MRSQRSPLGARERYRQALRLKEELQRSCRRRPAPALLIYHPVDTSKPESPCSDCLGLELPARLWPKPQRADRGDSLRVSFHVSPLGPAYFDFEEVCCPVFIANADGSYFLFDEAVQNLASLDSLIKRVGSRLNAYLEEHALRLPQVSGAQETASLVWYLSVLQRQRESAEVVAEALRHLSAAKTQGELPRRFSEPEARAWLGSRGIEPERWQFGLGRRLLTASSVDTEQP